MLIPPVFRAAFFCFFLIFSFSSCNGENDSKRVQVVGIAECADCALTNIKTSQALSGLHVSIDCKPKNGKLKTVSVGQLDDEGKFKVDLPSEMVKDGKLKEECYAQVRSASATPCQTHSGLNSSKILLKSQDNEIYSFELPSKLKISLATCTSKFLWPHFKYPNFKPTWKLPPLKFFGHPHLVPHLPHNLFPPHFHHHPPLPIYKPPPCPPKVLPPPVPVYKPPLCPPKALPPPVPVYKPPPCPPKVLPPPVPVYKPPPKPLPPPVPIYKPPPCPPKVLPPPVPTYKPPPVPVKKPCPPKHPFFHHKPLPPLPKIPPFHKKPCPPLPKLPPKYFHHPKFGKWPPIPPHNPIN